MGMVGCIGFVELPEANVAGWVMGVVGCIGFVELSEAIVVEDRKRGEERCELGEGYHFAPNPR